MKKNTFRFLLTGVVFLLCINAIAQNNESDSLNRLLASKIPDTVRVNLLNALSKSYFSSNPDTAIAIAMSSKKIAEEIKYYPGLALAWKYMSNGYYLEGKYIETVKACQQAMEVYKKMGDKVGVSNMISNQGAVYFNQGDDAKALELYLQALKMAEDLGDTLRKVTCLYSIGAIYLNKPATYNKALDYFEQSYKLSVAIHDQYSIGTSTANLGEVYYKMGDDSKALYYLEQSVKAYEGTEDLPYSLNYIGRIYVHKKQFDKAIEIHKQAFELSEKLDTKLDQTQSLVGLGQAYQAKGEISPAIAAYKQAVEIGLQLNANAEIKDAYQGLSLAYSKQKDFVNAYKYQDLLLAIKDTIYNINTDKKLGTLQFGFDMEKKESEIKILNQDKEIQEQEIKRQKIVKYSFIGGFAVMLLFATVFFAQRNRIHKAKQRSDELLLNILPEETAEELKETGTAKTKSFSSVSVLFTDFKNFTIASEKLTPEELVEEINHCYSAFDRIVEKYGIEKIKTIGDSYMCAGGLPVTNTTHPFDIVKAGLEMVKFIEDNKQDRMAKGQPYFELRCGIHTGPVVAGIVGIKKFAYDIWGDTVNTASRMESSGGVGKVNVSETTYEIIKDKFTCVHRGKIEAKNKGSIDMYFVEGLT